MKKFIVIFAVLTMGIALSWSAAFAVPGLPTNWKIKYESFVFLTPNINQGQEMADGIEDKWGILKVTSIIDRLTSAVVWSDGDGGWQITGMFYNMDIDEVATRGSGFTLNNTERIIQPQLDLYIQNVADAGFTSFNPSGGPGARIGLNSYPSVTDGMPLFRALYRPGVLPIAFPLPYVDGAPFDPVDTVVNFDLDSLTVPFTGDGTGYLDVIPGSGPWADIMNTNSFLKNIDTDNDGVPDTTVTRDIFLLFDIRTHPDPGLPNWGWTANSEDPIIGSLVMPICGDGIVGNTPGETCDPPGSNAGQPNECRQDCTYCGDGHLDAGEQCDDGNNINGDGCSATCTSEQLFGGCRMTGGHNTVAPDGSYYVVPGGSEVIRNVVSSGKKNTTTTTEFKYTVGGQIGAPEAGCCTPGVDCAPGNGGYGEWEHSHHENGTLKFSFHAGTHSAPPDSYIQCITCTDPGWCVQARCAPFKQIFWEGTGVFQNPNQKSDSPFTLSGCTIDPNAGKTHSLHYYQAHVGDFGEPGNTGKQKTWDPNVCHWISGGVEVGNTVLMTPQPPVPDPKFGDKGGQSCDACPDWYEIEVHCTADPSSPIIYRAAGYLTGGNHQIHPEVGQQCPY